MAKNSFSISVVISAVDKITAQVRKINEGIQKRFEPLSTLSTKMKDLWKEGGGEKLTSAFGNFGKSVGNVGKELGALATKAALFGGVAIAGIVALVKSTVEAGDQIAALRTKTGIGAEALQEFQFAAERSDISVESFNSGLLTFTKNMGMAKAGTGKLASLLKKVNPAFLTQLKSVKDNEQAFLMIVDAMHKVKDPQRRLALATAAFGGAGAELVSFADKGKAGLAELRAEAQRLGIVMDENAVDAAAKFDDSMINLGAALTGIRNKIAIALLPVLEEWIQKVTVWVSANKENIKQFAAGFANFISETLPKLKAFAEFILGFFFRYDEATGKFTARTGNIRLAMLALVAVVMGPLLAALGSMTVAFVQLGIAIGATPVGWIAAALMGLIVVGALVWAYWDDIREFFSKIWNEPEGALQWYLSLLMKSLFLIPGLVINNWATLKEWFVSFFDWLSEKLSWAFEKMKPLLNVFAPGARLFGEVFKSNAKALGFGAERSSTSQAATALSSAPAQKTETKVMVDFSNLPRGSKVSSDSSKGADFDLGLNFGPMATMN